MLYPIQVILYTTAMLLIYGLFLRNRPIYQFSRYYLIACALLPLLIPLVQLPEKIQHTIQNAAPANFDLPILAVNANNTIAKTHDGIPWLWWGYSLIVLLFIAWQLRNGYKLWLVIKQNKKEDHGAYSLITTSGYGPGSFGRYIFFPGSEINETILAHEQAHIRLHHTRDIILLNIIQAATWPNLFLVWIKKELEAVHEFQADALVNADKEAYTQLLLCSVFNTRSVTVMHSFSIHPLKRRIMMLYKNGKANPVKAALLVSVSIFALLSISLCVQSCKKHIENKPDELQGFQPLLKFDTISTHYLAGVQKIKNVPITVMYDTLAGNFSDKMKATYKYKEGVLYVKYDTASNKGAIATTYKINKENTGKPDANGIYTMVSKMPQPVIAPGAFITQHLADPEYAKRFNKGGMVVPRFVIDENGHVTNVKILQSPDPALSEEVIKLIKQMPDWIPGEQNGKKVPVYFTFPILLASINKK